MRHLLAALTVVAMIAAPGCASLPKVPHPALSAADLLETACALASRPLPGPGLGADAETACAELPGAIRLAVKTGDDVKALVAEARALAKRLGA